MTETNTLITDVMSKSGTGFQRAADAAATRFVSLINVPIHFGGPGRGTSMGPEAVSVADLHERLKDLGLTVASEVDIDISHSTCRLNYKPGDSRCLPEIKEVALELADAVQAAMRANTIPIVIGGDHSLAIGSLAGVANHFRHAGEKFGLIWFDAHGDINTPETSRSGNVHGMPLAVALGHGDERLTGLLDFAPKVDAAKTVLIGIRDLDPLEREMIDKTGITAFTMRDVDQLGMSNVIHQALTAIGTDISGIHLSFDIDVMDPDTAPGVTTPAPGGLTYREAACALTLLAKTKLIRSIDIVELNPARDLRNRTADLAVDLIAMCLGQRIL